MTSKKHKRCLDRVYEAASKMKGIRNNDIVICVQGDEPMMQTSMIIMFDQFIKIKKLVRPSSQWI